MLKNIERMQARGQKPKQEYINHELYSFGIPPAILKQLRLKVPGENTKKRATMCSTAAASKDRDRTVEHRNSDV